MSFILDALRRADAQRERDPARGIHAQSIVVAGSDEASYVGKGLWWAVTAVVVVVVAVAAAWWSRSQESPSPKNGAAPASAPVAQGSGVDPGPGMRVTEKRPSESIWPPVSPMRTLAQPPGAAMRGAQPAGEDLAAPGSSVVPRALPAPSASASPAATMVAGALPADAPKVAISGGVYSANAAQRMLIVNGQVYNEGAEPVSGVVIERIRPNVAVLRFRGQRYMVAY